MIDAHIHLADDRFSTDRDRVIERAKSAGVTAFFCAAARPSEFPILENLAQRPEVVPFAGTHPWYANEYDPAALTDFLNRHPDAGVGETGLDAPRGAPEQTDVFKDQLRIAALFKRPCVIHCVKSFDAVAAVLKQMPVPPPALLFHRFSGILQQADFLMRFNAFFSFSGTVLSENRAKARAVLAALPADRLLAETDAPDGMPPERFRANADEKRNVGENLPLIIQAFAAIRKTDFSTFTAMLDANARRFLSGGGNGE